jgi:hypothetical protein
MPTNVTVIQQSEFVRARPDGTIDFEAGERLLSQIAEAYEAAGGCEVLLDVRNITGRPLSTDDMFALAAKFARFREATFKHRMAILCEPERFERAKLFASLAGGPGRVKAFVAYENAMEWLLFKE